MTRPIYPHPKPTPAPARPPKRINLRNEERRAAQHARNYPERPEVEPWCFVLRLLDEYRRRHGAKMVPAGWSPCSEKIDAAHATRDRGMGGVNSSASDVVYACRTHHDELGRIGRPAFEALYRCDLAAEAAREADREDMHP